MLIFFWTILVEICKIVWGVGVVVRRTRVLTTGNQLGPDGNFWADGSVAFSGWKLPNRAQPDRNPPSPQTLSLLILVSCQTDSCYYLLINLVTRSVRKENLYCFSFATTELASNNNSISVYMAWFCIPLLLNKYALVLNLGLASYLL